MKGFESESNSVAKVYFSVIRTLDQDKVSAHGCMELNNCPQAAHGLPLHTGVPKFEKHIGSLDVKLEQNYCCYVAGTTYTPLITEGEHLSPLF